MASPWALHDTLSRDGVHALGPALKISPSKLGLLSALYFVQGMPFGFQSTALPIYLIQQGVSVAAIGFLSVLWLPWLLKPLWAPAVERYGSERIGRRKSWILPLQAALGATCLAASFATTPEAIPMLLGLVFVMNLFAATQDIPVDGMAVELLKEGDLGWGNAVQVGAYKLGALTGGGVLGWASQYIGWQGLFLIMGGLSLLVMIVTAFSQEPRRQGEAHAERTSLREVLSQLKSAMAMPGTGWLLIFIGTYKLGESMSDVLYKPFLLKAGFEGPQVAWWTGTYGTVASLTGTVVGGWIATRLPLLGALAVTSTLRIFPLIGRWLLAAVGPTAQGVIGVTLAEEFFGGALTTALFAFMMSRVDRRIGAAHFTLLAGVELLGKMPGGAIGGLLVGKAHWSYAQAFFLGVALSVAFLFLLLPLRQRKDTPAPQPSA
jgi:MFS transporter, PAT family, beta-lactamase induction signal transducer AmpG